MFSLAKEMCYENKDVIILDTIQTYLDSSKHYRYLNVYNVYITEHTCIRQLVPDSDYYQCLAQPTQKVLTQVRLEFKLDFKPLINTEKQIKVLIRGVSLVIEKVYRVFGSKPESNVNVETKITPINYVNYIKLSELASITPDLADVLSKISSQISSYTSLLGHIKTKTNYSLVNEKTIGLNLYETQTLTLRGYHIADSINNQINNLSYILSLSNFTSRVKAKVIDSIELMLD